MIEINNLLVAFSSGYSGRRRFEKTLSNLLGGNLPLGVTAVNDPSEFVRKYFEKENVPIALKGCRNRLEARSLVSKASHVLVFWSGEDFSSIVWAARQQRKPLRICPFEFTKVVNRDAGEEYDVYIGRSGPWGNPFPIVPGTDQTREKVIARYAEYFEQEILPDPVRHQALLGLRGLRLACHCKPQACHGDVIANYLNNYGDASDEIDEA